MARLPFWLVAAVVMGLGLWSAPSASAAWTPWTNVSPEGVSAAQPQVALDGEGNATAVWLRGGNTVRSAFRPAGGVWGDEFTRMGSAGAPCGAPQLAVNEAGAAVVVSDCSGSTVRAAYRAAGGSWAGSVAIPGASGSGARVGIDGLGWATAVWRSGTEVWSSRRVAGAGGSWEAAPLRVSPPGTVAMSAGIAVSPAGYATAYWRRDLFGDQRASVESSERPRSVPAWSVTPASLTAPSTSTSPVVFDPPQIRYNGDDRRMAVWAVYPADHLPTASDRARLQTWWGDPGSWGGGTATKGFAWDGVTSVEVPTVALDGNGRATAVWRSYDPGSGLFRAQAATTSAINGSWSAPVFLSSEQIGLAEPQVAASENGDATAVFRAFDGAGHAVIRAATRTAGGALGPGVPISDLAGLSDAPAVAMDEAGNAVVVWQTSAARIATAVNDVTPPVLGAVVVPAVGELGVPLAMSASATDAWSGPPTLTWDFGDGTAGVVGESVSHAYAASGARTVTVTATDGAGNVASGGGGVTVAGLPPGGGGPPGAGGGAPSGGGGSGSPARAVSLGVTVPKQTWKKIRKAKAVTLRCSLDVPGRCRAVATVTRKVAVRLGLKIGKRKKTLQVGVGTATVTRGGTAYAVKVTLTRKARAAIAKATRKVPITLIVTGSATGRLPATLAKKLTIRR